MSQRIIKCSFCGEKGAQVRRVIQSFGRGADKFLVRNIPTISCPNCGEMYLTARTLHELERIKTHRDTLVVKRKIAIADFPAKPGRRAG